VEDDLGSSGELLVLGVDGHGESTSGTGLPSPLVLIFVGLRDDGNSISHQISGIETHTKLTNHGNIGTTGESLHKGLSTGLSDGTKIINQLLLSHTNTGIPDGQSIISLIGDNSDSEVGLHIQLSTLGIGNRLISDLIKGIRCIRNQLS